MRLTSCGRRLAHPRAIRGLPIRRRLSSDAAPEQAVRTPTPPSAAASWSPRFRAPAWLTRVAAAAQDVVICGAGVAGCAAAYHLARLGVPNVVVITGHTPLTLTSAMSTECYRDYWPTYTPRPAPARPPALRC